jgi:hypothetical protein
VEEAAGSDTIGGGEDHQSYAVRRNYQKSLRRDGNKRGEEKKDSEKEKGEKGVKTPSSSHGSASRRRRFRREKRGFRYFCRLR